MASWFQPRPRGGAKTLCYLIPSHISAKGREKGFLSFPRSSAFLYSQEQPGFCQVGLCIFWAFLHMNHSLFLYVFLINIVAATACFLISLLFPVNCSYLELWSVPFTHPVLLPGYLEGVGGRSGGGSGASKWQCGLESLGRRTKLWSTIPKPQQMGKTNEKRALKASKGQMA